MKYLLFPPASVLGGCNVIAGATYQSAQGVALQVPNQAVANQLVASGWTNCAIGGADVTANRPVPAAKGVPFIDMTLGLMIVNDGANWRNPITNAIV